MTTTPFDEFSFLSAQAAGIGVTAIPPVRRLTLPLPDGRTVSALHYGDPVTGEFAPPAVTFLHGAGLNAHTWDTTILALGRPALAIDLPGHGDSSWRADGAYTGRTLAADLADVLAHWAPAPQLLVGQSLGGLCAAALAAAHPALVRALIVVDISPGLDPNGGASQIRAFFAGPSDWASREELVDRALAFGFGGSREAATRGVFLNSRIREDGRVEWKHHFAHLAHLLATDRAAAAAADTAAAASTGVLSAAGWDDLAAVAVPLTLIRGERGYVSPADVDEYARRLPAAEIITVEAGHNVQEDVPVRLAALIAERVDDAR